MDKTKAKKHKILAVSVTHCALYCALNCVLYCALDKGKISKRIRKCMTSFALILYLLSILRPTFTERCDRS